MWSARARWRVFSGELQSAVSLTQGTHTEWEDIGPGAADDHLLGESCLGLNQSGGTSPCEVTVDFPESSFFVSLIKLSSTARTCEVYSRKLGSQDHEYVCTVRGKEEETPLPANPPAGLLTQPCPEPPQEQIPQSPGHPGVTPLQRNDPQGGAGVKSFGLGGEEAQGSGGDAEGSGRSEDRTESSSDTTASEPLPAQAVSSLGEPGLDATPLLNPDLQPVFNHAESDTMKSGAPLTPPKPTLGTTPKPHLPTPSVPFYTCYIKLARGPAFMSLRFKFLSLQNKMELQLRPIHIYASRGPAAVTPPRLTANSLSALAPLLPALGPLLNSGVSGLPQLPGGYSHLLTGQQEPVSKPHQGELGGAIGVQGGSVNGGAASGGRTHQGGLPPGLAQLMASFQGMRTGGAPSQSVAGADSPLGKSSVQTTGPPFDPLTRLGNAPNGSPSSVTRGLTNPNSNSGVFPGHNETDAKSLKGARIAKGSAPQSGTAGEGESAQQATLEAVLRRLEGLEATCLRIEHAVTGALSGFDARLTRLEERDSERGGNVNALGTGVNRLGNGDQLAGDAHGSSVIERKGSGDDETESGVSCAVSEQPAVLGTVAGEGSREANSGVNASNESPIEGNGMRDAWRTERDGARLTYEEAERSAVL